MGFLRDTFPSQGTCEGHPLWGREPKPNGAATGEGRSGLAKGQCDAPYSFCLFARFSAIPKLLTALLHLMGGDWAEVTVSFFLQPLVNDKGRRNAMTISRAIDLSSSERRQACWCADAQEEALVAQARAGDADAFAALVQRYRDRLLNLAWQLLGDRDEAEDAVQDAFLFAYEHLSQFRGEARLSTWLYRITINACKMRRRRHRFEPLPDDWEPPDEVDWRSLEAQWWRKRQVDAVLRQLPEPLRLVLILREMHDLRYDEIAAVLDIPVGTVRSRLFEARKRFARVWEEMFGREA